MKTINDLVKKLNIFFGYGDFYIDKDNEKNSYTLCLNYLGSHDWLVEFDKEYKDWIVEQKFGLVPAEIQKMIMDFVYTTDKEHWFDEPEKKYYIAVGMYDRTSKIIYFKNDNALDFKLRTMIDFDEKHLQEDDIFTEKEIEELKSTLPTNMAKIVELGKVEVKDD